MRSAYSCENTHYACLRQQPDRDMMGFAARFQRRLAGANRVPWLLATGEDFRWPTTQGGRPNLAVRLVHRYLEQVIGLIPQSRVANQTFLEVGHLIQHPLALLRPALALQALPRLLARRHPTMPPRESII